MKLKFYSKRFEKPNIQKILKSKFEKVRWFAFTMTRC